MKKLFALGAATLLAFGLASCGEATQQPTEPGTQPAVGKKIDLIYSGTLSNKDFNMGLFEDFKAAMKAAGDPNEYNITYEAHGPDMVDSEVVDWSVGPDVYEFASDKLANLFSKGALAKVVGQNAAFIEDELNGFAKACATFNDQYFAYPYTGDNTYYLQYDKSVITEEQAKDMMALMDAAHAKGKKVGYNLPEGFWGAGAMFTFGADYKIKFSEDGNIESIVADFNGEKGLKAAKAILQIVQHPAFLVSSAVPASKDSDVCAVIGGTWDILTYDADKDLYGGYKTVWGDDYGCAVMPTVTVDGETRHLGAFLGGKLLGVNPQQADGDEERLAAAHKLAKFLAGKECQLKRFEEYEIAPCHIEAAKDPKVLASPNIAVLAAQGEFAHAQTSVPGGVWSAPGVMVNAMKDGKCTLENLQEYLDAFNNTVIGK